MKSLNAPYLDKTINSCLVIGARWVLAGYREMEKGLPRSSTSSVRSKEGYQEREMILRTCTCTVLSRAIPNPFLYFPLFFIVPIFARRRLRIFFFFHKSPSKRESSYIRSFRLLDTINNSNSLFLANGCHLLA